MIKPEFTDNTGGKHLTELLEELQQEIITLKARIYTLENQTIHNPPLPIWVPGTDGYRHDWEIPVVTCSDNTNAE